MQSVKCLVMIPVFKPSPLTRGSCEKIYETLKRSRKISPSPSFSKRGTENGSSLNGRLAIFF
jgi:hypothetical protein